MKKTILLLLILLSLFQISNAQCPVPPHYLNAAHYTSAGFEIAFEIDNPVCDSIYGWQLQWKQVSAGSWISYTFDSTNQNGSNAIWGGFVPWSLTVGQPYTWRVRMIMYAPNGSPVYSAWTNGNSFVPITEAITGCDYPGPLSLYPPGSSDVLLYVVPDHIPGWDSAKAGRIQYKPTTSSTWTNIDFTTPYNIFYYVAGLNSSTTYQWRTVFACKTNEISKMANGPNFTTPSPSSPQSNNKRVFKEFVIKPSQVIQLQQNYSHMLDEGITAVIISPNPASTQFKIHITSVKNQKITATLKNATGNIFWHVSNVSPQSLNSMNVNVSSLKPGIYYLQVGDMNSTVTQKIIISR